MKLTKLKNIYNGDIVFCGGFCQIHDLIRTVYISKTD